MKNFPKTGALLARRNVETGEVSFSIVVRSEPTRGFVIILDGETFTTSILHLQAA